MPLTPRTTPDYVRAGMAEVHAQDEQGRHDYAHEREDSVMIAVLQQIARGTLSAEEARDLAAVMLEELHDEQREYGDYPR